MGVKLGRLHWGRNVGWGALRIEFWGEYLELKRSEITGEWIWLHNEKLNDPYSAPNIIRVIKSERMRWARLVARMGERRGTDRVLVGKREGKWPLGRPSRRCEDNIKMDLHKMGWGHGLDWAGSGWERLGGTCKRGNEPPGSIKCREFLD